MSETGSSQAPSAAALILGSLGMLGLFRILGAVYRQDYVLDLGTLGFPAPLYAAFLLVWCIFGTLSLGLMTWGISRLAARPGQADEFAREWQAASDTRWVTAVSLLALLLPFLLRVFVFRGARITDDEAAYRFMAELIASGRVSVPSPPMKDFFDNAFMINDGRLYAKYFLGWPALLAPGVLLGSEGVMNPLYFGLTVPPVYAILKQQAGVGWARAGVILMVTAPMLLFGAATLMSHTSCMCVLAWAWYFALRTRRATARTADHALFALLLALACFVRPISALGIGIPLGLHWLGGVVAQPARRRATELAVFAAIAVAAAVLFGIGNQLQTGDPFTIAYASEATGGRFTALPEDYRHMQFTDPLRALAVATTAFLRLSFALFGWPIGLAVALLAIGQRGTRLAWLCALGFALVHLPTTDPGIDTFGPVHYYEIALPVVVLCAAGLSRAGGFLSALPIAQGRVIAPSLLVSLIAVSWLGYMPVRAATIVRLTDDLLEPEQTVARAGLTRAVVFSPRPFAARCRALPSRHFVFFRPNNDPDLQNDVLWVNDLGLPRNRELMRSFPERRGYVLARFVDCSMQVVPLEEADALEHAPSEALEPPGLGKRQQAQ